MEIRLGERYRDEITGFEGVATSRTEYLYGCVRVVLEAEADGKPDEFAFDEQRLVAVNGARPTATATSGGQRRGPARRTVPRR